MYIYVVMLQTHLKLVIKKTQLPRHHDSLKLQVVILLLLLQDYIENMMRNRHK